MRAFPRRRNGRTRAFERRGSSLSAVGRPRRVTHHRGHMDEQPRAVAVQSRRSAAWVDEVWPQSSVLPQAAPPARRPGAVRVPALAPVPPKPPARPVAEEPRIQPDRALVVLEERRGCGDGRWCRKCRQEIRDEALRWIRELNAPPEWGQSPGTVPYRPWHADLLLGDS